MESSEKQIYRFADIEVDLSRNCLRRGNKEEHLRKKTFSILVYLIRERGRVVTKEELFATAWKDTAVTDGVLLHCIKEIRQALGDDSHRPRFIKTVPKTGYRFIGEVREEFQSPVKESEEQRTKNDGRKMNSQSASKNRRLVLAGILVSVAALAFLGFLGRSSWKQSAEVVLPIAPGKRSVAIMFFENQSKNTKLDWLREGIADMLISNLSRSEKLIVLNRQQLRLLLERSEYKTGDGINLEKALEIARKSRAEALIVGSFATLGEKTRLDAQIYEVKSGELLTTESLTVERAEQILTEIDGLSMRLAVHLGAGDRERMKIDEVMTDNLEAYRYYSLAVEKAQAFHTNEAIEFLEKAVSLDPQFAMAYARLGYIHTVVRVDEGERGKPFLEKAFALSHRLTERDKLYIQAWYAMANKDREATIQNLHEIIARFPSDTETYFRLGNLLRHQGQTEEAIEVYERGITFDPEAQNIYNGLGFCYSELARYDEAIAAHRRYAQLAPAEPNAYDSLGITLTEAGRYTEAHDTLNRALDLKPDFHFANLHLGDVYFRRGKYREAIKQFERYLQLAPTDWDKAIGYNRLALLYAQKGDLIRAEKFARGESKFKQYRSAFLIALARNDLQTAENLKENFSRLPNSAAESKQFAYFEGYYAQKTGRHEAAFAQFKRVTNEPPFIWNNDGIPTMDCLGNAFLQAGRFDEAIAEYERILQMNAYYPLARFHLAQAFERKGQIEKARENYRLFLETWKDADADIPEIIAAKKYIGIL